MPKKLREELTRALLEATGSDDSGGIPTVEAASYEPPVSFKDLVKDMTLNRHDIKAFAFNTKAMVITYLRPFRVVTFLFGISNGSLFMHPS